MRVTVWSAAGGAPGGVPPAAMAAMSAMSAKPEINYNLHHLESEYFNTSVCETASVASDLTRMYVSDEEEKPEPLRPTRKLAVKASDELSSSDTDSVTPAAEKRPRVTFFPTF